MMIKHEWGSCLAANIFIAAVHDAGDVWLSPHVHPRKWWRDYERECLQWWREYCRHPRTTGFAMIWILLARFSTPGNRGQPLCAIVPVQYATQLDDRPVDIARFLHAAKRCGLDI